MTAEKGPAALTTSAAGKLNDDTDKVTGVLDLRKSRPINGGSPADSNANESAEEEDPERSINTLLDLFQWDVALVPNHYGKKKPKIKNWQKRTSASMNDPEYLKHFDGANIGVALGDVSSGLCTIDIDDDAAFDAFIAQNPDLKWTLRSRGARGGAIWIKFQGIYPNATQSLKNEAGEEIGEFRSNGAQQIIQGRHPGGMNYRITSEQHPVKMSFPKIVWGPLIPNPPRLLTNISGVQKGQKGTEGTDVADGTDGNDGIEVVCGGFQPHVGFISNIKSIDDVVKTSLPTTVNQNHKLLFRLARGILTLELVEGRKFSPNELKDVFNMWYQKALPFLRPGLSREDYFMEFLEARTDANRPLGSQTIARALANAKSSPPPPEADQFENPNLKLLVGVCRQLQIEANKRGDDRFFLSLRMIQLLFNQENHTTAGKWMKALRALRIIDVVEMGVGLRATRYKYNGTM